MLSQIRKGKAKAVWSHMWNLKKKKKKKKTHRKRKQIGGCLRQREGVGETDEGGQKVQTST